MLVAALPAQAPIGFFLRQATATPTRFFITQSLAYDPLRQVVVAVFGDANGRTTWEFAQTWLQRQNLTTPFVSEPLLAYDLVRQRVVLVGGGSTSNAETWEYDGTAWTQQPSPSGQLAGPAGLAFDASRGVLVMVTIGTQTIPSSTWERTGTTWVLRTNGGPLPRSRLGLAFDSGRGLCVLYGGTSSFGHLGDTWEWNGSFWIQRFPSGSGPGPRYGHALAYDAAQSRTCLFGGYDANNNLHNDVWEYDGAAWVQRTTSSPPDAQPDIAATWHTVRQCLVVVGTLGVTRTTFDYRVVTPVAGALTAFGTGCAPAAGGPALQLQTVGTNVPRIGQPIQANIANVPAGALPFLLFGIDNTQWNGNPLPLVLDPMGFTGCTGYLAPTVTVGVVAVGSTAPLSILVQSDPNLIGVHFFLQAMAFAASANAGGALFSNALAGTVGTP